MEVLNTPILQKLSGISVSRPKSSFPCHYAKAQLRSSRGSLNLLLKISFSSRSHFSVDGRKLLVSAHFRRHSNRRNSLRKKLTDEQQVRRNLDSFDPDSNFQNLRVISDETESSQSNRNCGNSSDSCTGAIIAESSLSNLNYGTSDEGSFVMSRENIADFSAVEKTKFLSDSVLWSKLENWVDQYKNDVEFWGIGSGSVFTIFQDLEGNVERVSVNEDEILRRSRVVPWAFRQQGLSDNFTDVNFKISYAKRLAREIEAGEYKIPKNSSIAKFVVSGKESGFINGFRAVTFQPHLFAKLSRVGFAMLCGSLVFLAVKKLLVGGDDGPALTREEKEMLRRKMKSRMEKGKMEKGSVEVLPDASEPLMESAERPRLDKQELMKSILKARTSETKLALLDSSNTPTAKSIGFDDKIQEIREMARLAQELEQQDSSTLDRKERNELVHEDISTDMENGNGHEEVGVRFLNSFTTRDSGKPIDSNGTSLGGPKGVDSGFLGESSHKDTMQNIDLHTSFMTLNMESLEIQEGTTWNPIVSGGTTSLSDTREELQTNDTCDKSVSLNKNFIELKSKVIRSVKEARKYLSRKHRRRKPDQEHQIKSPEEGKDAFAPAIDQGFRGNTDQIMYKGKVVLGSSKIDDISNTKPVKNSCEYPTQEKTGINSDVLLSSPVKVDTPEEVEEEHEKDDLRRPRTTQDVTGTNNSTEAGRYIAKDSWMEKNFQEFEPIVKKIGIGFRENYMVAKDKVQEELISNNVIAELGSNKDGNELEWMKDDCLREIVFQVRENELAGKDPFHLMDEEDKNSFFKGLEKKVESENAKLQILHEWIHSRIENLDYGADGISLHDPPERIIPRWKGPPVDKNPEFLRNFVGQQKAFAAGNTRTLQPVNGDIEDRLQRSEESKTEKDISTSPAVNNLKKSVASKKPKTIIECSDGSVRSGKKSGKEYWQHTKKWSREFLEAYNAETDPEIKSIMKDMGKDLDRWITEKEIQETADLLTKIPMKKRRYIEKKLDKLKKEMEMFGPQAVVSKYREYAEEKEEDYLWWLDLPFILCIELYTNENDTQEVGFYSLEMAADLELDPKQYHVIAFEDPGDSKNFCYIIQAHMDLLGNGYAFVVARPPKDAFREAKANGFSVTVIRKGELQLNIDQTLEEVEEQITEIGSKFYHDKIMRERSVDMGSLMKGVFGASKTTKRKAKLMVKKPTRH
ncbi:PREDICTED: uncharacterized protein LOC104604789 isoform X2 [Nelumbo nucifera]|uniref:Embryo defective 1703 n=2 Tax=Nelumbo nucifera TaxID=4432 RepID=A0A822XGE3_NELNU|nr:PREDICTED: uncharacterized protein LOC104604789 isoform X2 [Nelumbo nucifera]DAD17905.1 TPA_asm: hypothetical protein HUJ06_019368 [Nelumbo nucifera]